MWKRTRSVRHAHTQTEYSRDVRAHTMFGQRTHQMCVCVLWSMKQILDNSKVIARSHARRQTWTRTRCHSTAHAHSFPLHKKYAQHTTRRIHPSLHSGACRCCNSLAMRRSCGILPRNHRCCFHLRCITTK